MFLKDFKVATLSIQIIDKISDHLVDFHQYHLLQRLHQLRDHQSKKYLFLTIFKIIESVNNFYQSIKIF
jgi:hypothetical protein